MVIIEPENNFSSLKTHLLVNYVFTNDVSSLSLSKVTPDFDPIIGEIIESKEFTAKDGTMCIIHNKVGSDIKRVLLLGMGNRENLDTEKTRNLTGKVVNKAKEYGAAATGRGAITGASSSEADSGSRGSTR